ncbi:hypothetical protein AbraIFM66951_007888 [Aspergillus brasiliensis]|nr:hypothetical protein AbraIFM66951_007888 [Aspergillus brasiliensis]
MVQIWGIDGEPVAMLEYKSGGVRGLAFSPDGTQLAVGTQAGTIEIWNLLTRHVIYRLEGHLRDVEALSFSPDGRRLMSFAYNEDAVRIWDLHGSRAVNQRPGSPIEPYERIYKYIVSPGGQTALFMNYRDVSEFWDLATGTLQHRLTEKIGRFAAFSPDSKYAALITEDDCFKLMDTATWKPSIILESRHGVTASFSPDSRRVTFQSDDGVLQVYDIATGKEKHISQGIIPRSQVLTFSPNGNMVASSSGRNMTIWSFGKEPKQYEGDIGYGGIKVLAFSTSGKQIATGCENGYVRIFDLTTGEVLTRHTGYPSSVYSLEFAPDDTRIAARDINSVYIWEMAEENPTKKLQTYLSNSTRLRLFLNWEKLAMYTVDRDLEWVTYNGKRLLAIPADFRPNFIEPLSASSLLLIGEKSALGTLQFSPEPDLDNI